MNELSARTETVARPRSKAAVRSLPQLGQRKVVIDMESWRMLEFATRWLPAGDGDEFLLPEFGMTPQSFYRKLGALLEKMEPWRVEPAVRGRLRELCALKTGVSDAAGPARGAPPSVGCSS